MFTGIVEEIGTMRRIARSGQAMVLTVGARRILEDVHLGDSIAVNGVCLTIIAFDTESITVDVMPETFRHTNLGALHPGDRVNLERAMPAQGRFGGHMVQGHIDSPGTITDRRPEANAVVFTVRPTEPAVLKYVVPRGSIAVDGISLTVVHVTDAEFSVSIIPHTLAQTILRDKRPGDQVNMETDLTGKILERLLAYRIGEPAVSELENKTSLPARRAEDASANGHMTKRFLAENGFL